MDKLKPLIFSFSLKNPAPGRGFQSPIMFCQCLPACLLYAHCGRGWNGIEGTRSTLRRCNTGSVERGMMFMASRCAKLFV